jgi:hypothetical protein
MFNEGSSPRLIGCSFIDNAVYFSGGGMHNNGDAPLLTDCLFVENAAWEGGGISNWWSSPVMTNCLFVGNHADNVGGGIHNWGSSPRVINSAFLQNDAAVGAGMSNHDQASPALTNCTFFGNIADDVGGGIHNSQSSTPTMVNSILWKDYPDEVFNLVSTMTVTYSDIQGGYTGEGNIDADPLFADPKHGDFHLAGASPCIDAGLNAAPYLPATDYEGDDRILDGDLDSTPTVDMGIDEALEPVAITGLQVHSDSPTGLGGATTLTGTVTTGNNVRYEWAFGDGGVGVGDVVTHTYAAKGVYSVQLTASNMLGELSAATSVTVTDAPIEGLAATNDSPTPLGSATTLTATVSAGSSVTYTWTFGDGETGTGAVVSHTYLEAGYHIAIVTACNSANQLSATTTVTITEPYFHIYLPVAVRNH